MVVVVVVMGVVVGSSVGVGVVMGSSVGGGVVMGFLRLLLEPDADTTGRVQYCRVKISTAITLVPVRCSKLRGTMTRWWKV